LVWGVSEVGVVETSPEGYAELVLAVIAFENLS